jgi:hypothetical protein
MSEMEDDAKELLRRTLMTVSVGSLWLLVNSTLGLMFGWFFFDGKPTLGNYLFYAWFLFSIVAMIRYFIRTWRNKIHSDL